MTAPAKNRIPPSVKPTWYCGYCAGHTTIWCPICYGFEGCETCGKTYKVPCPVCSGGKLEKIRW